MPATINQCQVRTLQSIPSVCYKMSATVHNKFQVHVSFLEMWCTYSIAGVHENVRYWIVQRCSRGQGIHVKLKCVIGNKLRLVTCTLASCLGKRCSRELSCSEPVENSIRMMRSCSPYSYCVMMHSSSPYSYCVMTHSSSPYSYCVMKHSSSPYSYCAMTHSSSSYSYCVTMHSCSPYSHCVMTHSCSPYSYCVMVHTLGLWITRASDQKVVISVTTYM